MNAFNKFLLVFVITSLLSCDMRLSVTEEIIYSQDNNKAWIVADAIGSNFVLIDNNGISQSFTMNANGYQLMKSWGTFFGIINSSMIYYDYHYQDYISNYEVPYSLSLTAGFKPHGDCLYIELAHIRFLYDLKFKTISNISSDFGTKDKLITGDGYEELSSEKILSTVEILDSYSTHYHTYNTVLFFQLFDFRSRWNQLTVVKIYIAKNIGLVKYELKNGTIYVRK